MKAFSESLFANPLVNSVADCHEIRVVLSHLSKRLRISVLRLPFRRRFLAVENPKTHFKLARPDLGQIR